MIPEHEEDGPDWAANDELGFVIWCVEKKRCEGRKMRG